MKRHPIIQVGALGFIWPTLDPFLFCAHHKDAYPPGQADLGPDPALLRGRNLGMDFDVQDGFRMYHGERVPGFPRHPHRGFETVTIAKEGFIDHADSLGATARFGGGDVQWMTAGEGVVHAEMFPLVRSDAPNPAELFQIWLNLPSAHKMQPAHFTMLWHEQIPVVCQVDDEGRETQITVIAGELLQAKTLRAPPHSWAAQPDAEVNICTLKMPPGARCTLPAGSSDAHRVLYFFEGSSMRVSGQDIDAGQLAQMQPDMQVELENGSEPSELLLLHARPIGEPVAHHGPFVMNTRAELNQAMQDYQRTGFGGWPWPDDAPVHDRDAGRFAVHADGTVERPGAQDRLQTP